LPPPVQSINFPGEEGSNNEAISPQFTIDDNKKFARFLLPEGQEFSAATRKDATGLGNVLEHL
jgi:hypothetical protein